MNMPIHNASSLIYALRSRKAHLAGLLPLLNVKNSKVNRIKFLFMNIIKAMISALDNQLSNGQYSIQSSSIKIKKRA